MHAFIVPLLLLFVPLLQAQTISPGTATYTYQGCYNETTNINGTDGARALSNGASESVQNMTVENCIAFCEVRSYTFAGLEYTRECYCAEYLSSLSAKLPDIECNLACLGNGSEWCGGSLKLSVYKAVAGAKGGASLMGGKGSGRMGSTSVVALGVAVAGLLILG